MNTLQKNKPTIVHLLHEGDFGGIQRIVKGAFLDNKNSRYRHAAIICGRFGQVIGSGHNRYSLEIKNGFDLRSFLRIHAILNRYPRSIVLNHIDMPLARLLISRRYPMILMEHGCIATRKKFKAINQQLGKYACSHALGIICISNYIRGIFEKTYPMGRAKIKTLYNPVLVPFLSPRVFPKTTVTVGFIGRFSPEKGALDFIACANEIYSRRKKVRFIMIGNGPQFAEARLRAAILGVPVVFTGAVSDIETYLQKIDILAVTSNKDAFNMAVAEAMASGIPVAGFPAAAIPEIIRNKETGLLSGKKDASSLALVIMQLLDNAVLYESISRNALSFAKQRFDLNAYREQWDRIFDAAFNSSASHNRASA